MRLTLIPFAVAVALVSGCGGTGDSTSAEDLANSLCTSITTCSGSVKSAGESLRGGNLSENSLKSATSDIRSATDKLASDLKDLGKPDTEGGQQAKDAIDQLSSDVKDGVNTMQSAVENASGVNGAVTAASSITATLSTMGTQVSSAASKLEQADPKGELDQAFKDAPACKSLTTSSS